ncbi:MAG TPA: alpha/beta hydrolase [Burkholderiales bacterium]|nr:alpha/beta hydrolase [Burkholderiales bacterium]
MAMAAGITLRPFFLRKNHAPNLNLQIMKRLWICLGFLLPACASVQSPLERRNVADTIAHKQDWKRSTIRTGELDLMAYFPSIRAKAGILTIYIEGDGFAWINGSQPSDDPTPLDPVALRLALAHPVGNAAYVGRPCQYIDAKISNCPMRYWTDKRFAPEVVEATSAAIDVVKRQFDANKLTLVGYSGGGAVAALVAARRNDVERLVTVAGNLNHRAWTTIHRIQPLDGSLNPIDETDTLRKIRQLHFVGGKDSNITPDLVRSFVNRFPESQQPAIQIESKFDHRCCWAQEWAKLWQRLAPIGI